MPVRRVPARGDGRDSQFAALAAPLTTSISRGSLRCRTLYSTGSAFTSAAISSRNDSCANVFCRRAGDRNGPVNSGDCTSCVNTRSLRILPVPPARPFTDPETYDGTALLLFPKFAGSGAGDLAANGAGWNPASKPEITFPGAFAP